MENNLATPWTFRDGREYIINLNIHDKPKSLGIIITDKITAEEWSCHYDLKYIEELTQRTGNYKPFDTFISMIKTALLKSSEAVSIDLISYDDLKALKSRRQRHGFGLAGTTTTGIFATLGNTGQGALDSPRGGVEDRDRLSQRKYIIVTYVAEFDNVHYPIPVTYSGPPDPMIMQKTIRSLMGEVSLLKNSNLELLRKLDQKSLVAAIAVDENGNQLSTVPSNSSTKSDSPFPAPYSQPQAHPPGILRNKNRPQGPPEECHQSEIGQMQKLLVSVHRLEEKIVLERSEHLQQMERLQTENNYLRDKINELQLTEQALNRQICRLEEIVAKRNLTGKSSSSGTFPFNRDVNNNVISGDGGSSSSYRAMYRQHGISGAPEQKSSSELGTYQRNSYDTRLRSSSANSMDEDPLRGDNNKSRRSSYATVASPLRNRSTERKNKRLSERNSSKKFRSPAQLIRSRTASPTTIGTSGTFKPKFDPTAYVIEKKLRQEELAKIRMANIESKWKEIRMISGNAGSRSRSTSQTPQSRSRSRPPIPPLPSLRKRSISLGEFSGRAGSGDEEQEVVTNVPRGSTERGRATRRRRIPRSRSPPRNTEERLKQREKRLLEHGRNSERRINMERIERKLAATIGSKNPLKKDGKLNGKRLDLRLKDVESSLHALQAFIDATNSEPLN